MRPSYLLEESRECFWAVDPRRVCRDFVRRIVHKYIPEYFVTVNVSIKHWRVKKCITKIYDYLVIHKSIVCIDK